MSVEHNTCVRRVLVSAQFEGMIGIQQNASVTFEAYSANWGEINAKLEEEFKAGIWTSGEAKAKIEKLGFSAEVQAAIAIGAQWRRERVPVDRVLTSRWCRARDTARLLAVGTVTAYPDFDSSFTVSSTVAQRRTAKVRGIITRHRDQPGVLVLVGHQVNITALTGMVPSSGAAVVVKATSTGTLRVIGVLPAV